ncbi:MAG: hypothetical protein PHN98_06855 [Smithellaceae bacterium]|nr:hypothetical protein [Smithellaceae bacterium]
MAGIAPRAIRIGRVTLRALHEVTTSPYPLKLCHNSIYVITDKRSAIRNPGIMELVPRFRGTTSGCRPAPA